MFTGIVEAWAEVKDLNEENGILTVELFSEIANEFKVDQSVSHNGVCLTVTELHDKNYKVQAIEETLAKTNLGSLKIGDRVNLERSLKVGDRLDGHWVQGHVDAVAKLLKITKNEDNRVLKFQYPQEFRELVVEKGSITVNGVSLTVVDAVENHFSIALIPYTWEHTNLSKMKIGDFANIEFDILGKYFLKSMSLRSEK